VYTCVCMCEWVSVVKIKIKSFVLNRYVLEVDASSLERDSTKRRVTIFMALLVLLFRGNERRL